MTEAAPGDMPPDDLFFRLAELVRLSPFRPGSEISMLRRIAGGNSRETWFLDVTAEAGGQQAEAGGQQSVSRFVVTRDASGLLAGTPREVEGHLLAALAGTGLPVAAVTLMDASGSALGRPGLIVTRFDGVAFRHLLRRSDPAGLGDGGRLRIATDICVLLSRVHAVDVDTSGVAGVLGPIEGNPALAELEAWGARLDSFTGGSWPALELARDWLYEHLPAPAGRVVLVHGDFRPANVLIRDGQVEGLVDWEFARLGDPHDDLGWYLTPNYAKEHFISGRWEAAHFLRHYADLSNTRIDHDRLEFWRRMAAFRLAIMAIADAQNFRAGLTDHARPPMEGIIGQLAGQVVGSSPVRGGTYAAHAG